jgi:hypothetical protein
MLSVRGIKPTFAAGLLRNRSIDGQGPNGSLVRADKWASNFTGLGNDSTNSSLVGDIGFMASDHTALTNMSRSLTRPVSDVPSPSATYSAFIPSQSCANILAAFCLFCEVQMHSSGAVSRPSSVLPPFSRSSYSGL